MLVRLLLEDPLKTSVAMLLNKATLTEVRRFITYYLLGD